MSRRRAASRTLDELTELILKHENDGCLPNKCLFFTSELATLVLNKENELPSDKEVTQISEHLRNITKDYPNTNTGISKQNPLIAGSPRLTDPIIVWPMLSKRIGITENIFDYCRKIRRTKLRPFTSAEFRHRFSIGQIVCIRLSQEVNFSCMLIGMRNDSDTAEIQFVTFGGEDYTLPELKDSMEYWEDSQWKPFGVIE